jgi:hypothetical protein
VNENFMSKLIANLYNICMHSSDVECDIL